VKLIVAKFIADERGATAIEYGLIAAGIFARDHRRGQWPRHQLEYDVHLDQLLAEVIWMRWVDSTHLIYRIAQHPCATRRWELR